MVKGDKERIDSGQNTIRESITATRKAYNLQYDLLTYAEMQTMVNFFLCHGGNRKAFDFLDILDGVTTVKVRFDTDTLNISAPYGTHYSIDGLRLIEVVA